MVESFIQGTTSNPYIDCRIAWSSEVDTSSNTSRVYAELQYRRNNEGYVTYGIGTFSITIDGRTHRETRTIEFSDYWMPVISWSRPVSHNDDGTKIITISATGAIPGTTLESTNCSGTATLDTIPRASTIIQASNITLASKCSVWWTPRSSNFRYKLKFAIEEKGWSYTTEAIHPNQTSTYEYTGYTMPIDVARYITDTNIHPHASITLYTYSDANATKQVGTESTKSNVWIQIPHALSTRPTVSMSLAPVSNLPSTFSGLFIKGKSRVQATFSGEGKYGASIKDYSMSVSGLGTYSSPYQSDFLPNAGTVSVSGKSKDTRGFWSPDATEEINVIDYSKPMVIPATGEKYIICARCDENGQLSDSGTHLKIKAGKNYSKVIADGVQKNFCAIRYRYKVEGATSMSPWETISLDGDEIDITLGNIVTNTKTSYLVQVGVIDNIGESSELQFTIPTEQVTVHLRRGGKGLGIGKYAEDDCVVDIAEDWELNVRGTAIVKESLFTNHIKPIDNYANKDFNELIYNTGYYTGTAAPSSASCKNYPTNVTGMLEVVSAMVQNKETLNWWGFAYQTYRTYTGDVYMRSYYKDSGWTDWKKATLS